MSQVVVSEQAQKRVSFDHDLSQSSNFSSKEGDGDMGTAVTRNELLQADTKRVLLVSRIIVGSLISLAAVTAGVTAFFMTSNTQQESFEAKFDDAAYGILDSTHVVFDNMLAQFSIMSATMTSMATGSGNTGKEVWPFYNQPDFEVFGRGFLEGSGADMVSWSPTITGEVQREAWGNYSSENDKWVEEGLQWQASNHGLEMPDGPFDVPSQIYYTTPVDPSDRIPETGGGPFAPVWQMAGAPSDVSVVNYNLLSDPVFKNTFEGVTKMNSQTLSTLVNDASQMYGASAAPENGDIPQGLLMTPLYEDTTYTSSVGAVVAVFSWAVYFENNLQRGTPKVYAVVQNGDCDESFTLEVDGPQVKWLGYGDLHETSYTEFAAHSEFASAQTTYLGCTFRISVYPSQEFVETYENNEPVSWVVFVAGIIIVTGVIFFIYDLFVQKRQYKVLSSAAKDNAIVSSLFPKEVRDRLFAKDDKGKNGISSRELQNKLPESSRFRLRDYLSNVEDQEALERDSTTNMAGNNGGDNGKAMVSNVAAGVDMYSTKPIADLFPQTTIMFADIAGFTAWSSVREPSQVFTLLETVYQAFDNIAKRRKVFKVETVGDCYVAVAGLPEPRPDHGVVMARFSRECLEKFNELAKQLEITLGPDTADLAMRAGLHSGPVTAGVLRGDKSRFQLFGDTVNTAARIEGTGLRNKVHLSGDTAELLMKAGKEHWLKKRAELVTGKGKGVMQTYWLQSPGEVSVDERDSNNAEASKSPRMSKLISLDQVEDALPPKIRRLVSWNVEILKKLLQQIIAKRDDVGTKRNYDLQLGKMEATYSRRKYCLDEVTDSIALPKFDARAHGSKQNARNVEIPKKVVDQLRLFVSAVAAMHRDTNPFHNFEHASHVTMSVSKLLARIVAPDEVLNQTGDAADMAANLHDHTYGITSDPLTQFGCVLAALIHDTDHLGVSNFQLVKENHKIAQCFQGKSVAEQNSIVVAWEKLMNPRFEDLRRCIYSDPSELDRFRHLVVNNVLATDLFDKELSSVRKNRWDKAFQKIGSKDDSPEDDVNRKATVVMEHLIQASDVAHTMQHWHIYQKWNERLFAEMTAAYEAGRMDNNPVDGWYQGELGFFDNYVIPLANKLKECGVFGVSSDEYLNYALENRREWAAKGEDVLQTYIGKYCSAVDQNGGKLE